MEDRITPYRGGLSFSSIQLLIIVRALILLSPKRNFVRLSLHPLVITITSIGTICYRFHLPSHLSSSPTFLSLNVALALLSVLVDMCRSNTWDTPYI